jgi:hypothetical protein
VRGIAGSFSVPVSPLTEPTIAAPPHVSLLVHTSVGVSIGASISRASMPGRPSGCSRPAAAQAVNKLATPRIQDDFTRQRYIACGASWR